MITSTKYLELLASNLLIFYILKRYPSVLPKNPNQEKSKESLTKNLDSNNPEAVGKKVCFMDLQKFNRFLPHKIQKQMCEPQRTKELVTKPRNTEDHWEADPFLVSEGRDLQASIYTQKTYDLKMLQPIFLKRFFCKR